MKKHIVVLGVAAFVFLNSIPVGLAKDNPFTKFGRGMTNIVASPGELYTQPVLLAKENDAGTAIFGGLFKGLAMIVLREVVGVFEVATFFIPMPKKGYGPLFEPATTFTDWDTRQQ